MTKQYPEAPTDDTRGVDQLSRDNPEAYIARDRRHALSTGTDLPECVNGSALFADISGFTPLTEALRNELGPQRGAEELTRHLDRVFHAIIAELDRYGGNVIFFAGDAITCWFDGDDGRHAVASGLAMQKAIKRVGLVETGSGALVRMGLKVAIAVGDARRAVVGDPSIQHIDVLAGSILDDLAEVEQHADRGEILLNESVLISLGDRVVLSEQRIDPQSGQKLGVVECLSINVQDISALEPVPLKSAIIQQWLLPAVYERITTGRGEFVAELRPAYPVFIRFGGIDFDDNNAIDKLNDFVIRAQRIFDNYGGNVLQLTLGDKGAYLYGVFGSPVAHEDDAARAASASLKLITLDQDTAARDIQIGIAYGSLRSGTYGHEMRRTFVCLGDPVNQAARLMSVAPVGRIYVANDVRDSAGDAFIWEDLEPLKLKGKNELVTASVLTSSLAKSSRRKVRFELPIVGRTNELSILEESLQNVLSSRARVIGISAEAGLGKSRLVAEFVRELRHRGILVAFGECQSFGVNTSYFVWREIWQRLLDINEEDEGDLQRESIESALKNIDPVLVARAPLLSDVLGITIPNSELTASFDAKLRKSSLEDLLSTCLRDKAAGEPIVIVLEDSHWIDALSRDLLESLVRASASFRVLIVLAYRPATAPGGDLKLEKLTQFSEITLQELGAKDMYSVISSKAEQLFGTTDTPDGLVKLVINRSQGNPFYAEELLNYVASQGVQSTDDSALQELELPDSLHSLVLSRIDSLAEDPRRTLKIASVIGRLFRAPSLSGVYPDLGSLEEILNRLKVLQSQDLVTLDQEETLSYLFQHVVTHEVSYNSLPFAIRAGLHQRVGEFIEKTEAENLEQHLDLLAHHYWHSDNDGKKREYLTLAEESARHRYANDTAIEYGKRLATLVTGSELGHVLLRLGKVYELTGEWSRAEKVEQQAYDIAEKADDLALMARCEVAIAEVTLKQGRYEEAKERLTHSRGIFETDNDDDGLGSVLHISGIVAAHQGNYTAAQKAFEDSLLIRQQLDDQPGIAKLYNNMAIIAEYSNDYYRALSYHEKALKIRSKIGDRWGIGTSLSHVAMTQNLLKNYDEARDLLEESINIIKEVGDRWYLAQVYNNLGNTYRDLGEYDKALEYYAASLEGYGIFDDNWAMCFLFEDIAILASLTNNGEIAFELLGASDMLHEQIGSPRNPALEEDLAQRFSAVRQDLGKRKAGAALRRGKQHSITSATELGLRFTRGDQQDVKG